MSVKKMIIVPAVATVMFGGTFVLNSAMAGTCGPVQTTYSGNQDPDDDEFLYESKAEFDKAVSKLKNYFEKLKTKIDFINVNMSNIFTFLNK